jgi:hypothetical protein
MSYANGFHARYPEPKNRYNTDFVPFLSGKLFPDGMPVHNGDGAG